MEDKTKNNLVWLIFYVGVISLTVAIFYNIPTVRNLVKKMICDDRTGFCESKTIDEIVEKDTNGLILKSITKKQSGKTLWDWLGLAGTLAIPVLLVILSYQFQSLDKERDFKQAANEKSIANENSREQALQTYIDYISELMLNDKIKEKVSDNVKNVVRTKTLTIQRSLRGDKERISRLLFFLCDSGILESIQLVPFINLKDAYFGDNNLKEADLVGANLVGANLEGTDKVGVNLSLADLSGASLVRANLSNASLVGANLSNANLSLANDKLANLLKTNLTLFRHSG